MVNHFFEQLIAYLQLYGHLVYSTTVMYSELEARLASRIQLSPQLFETTVRLSTKHSIRELFGAVGIGGWVESVAVNRYTKLNAQFDVIAEIEFPSAIFVFVVEAKHRRVFFGESALQEVMAFNTKADFAFYERVLAELQGFRKRYFIGAKFLVCSCEVPEEIIRFCVSSGIAVSDTKRLMEYSETSLDSAGKMAFLAISNLNRMNNETNGFCPHELLIQDLVTYCRLITLFLAREKHLPRVRPDEKERFRFQTTLCQAMTEVGGFTNEDRGIIWQALQ